MINSSFDKRLVPTIQVSTLTSGVITLPSAKPSPQKANAGYVAGGGPGPGGVTTVDKWILSTEVRSTLATGLSTGMYDNGAFHQVGVAGYVLPGYGSGYLSVVNKFLRSDDSRSTLSSGLSSARYAPQGYQSSTSGYAVSGAANGSLPSTADKFSFADDSRSTLGTGTNNPCIDSSEFESGLKGYACGGYGPHVGAVKRDEITALTFSTETFANLSATLSDKCQQSIGWCSLTTGYVMGGSRPGDEPSGNYAYRWFLDLQKLDFSSETKSNVNNVFKLAGFAGAAFVSSTDGYCALGAAGWRDADGAATTTVEKVNFATDTTSTLYYGLSSARGNCEAGFEL